MLKILLEFFTVNKKIAIPQVGTFSVHQNNSVDDFGKKTISASTNSISFATEQDDIAIQQFEDFATLHYSKSKEEATQFYQDFLYTLNNDKRLNIDGLGILTNEENLIKFQQSYDNNIFFPVINAEKVIRNDAEHTITVGENERTSSQMRESLSKSESKKYWWVYILIALLVGVAAYFFYTFYLHK